MRGKVGQLNRVLLFIILLLPLAACNKHESDGANTQPANAENKTERSKNMEKAASNKKPNILFVLVDDMGYHQMESYGQDKIKTPNLHKLANEGIKFTQAYAGNTVCSPSRVSLFTGRDGRVLHDNSNVIKLRPHDVTFAHVLQKAGYETGLFGKWSLNDDLAAGGPLKMGFDTWFGMNNIIEGHRQWPTFLWRDDKKFTVEENLNGGKGVYAQRAFTDETIKFIKQERDKPFFAFLAYSSPHAELAAPKEFLSQYSGKFEEKPYKGMSEGGEGIKYAKYYPEPVAEPNATLAAMITAIDAYVGEIYEVLEAQGQADNTIIIFSSDNGPHDEGGADPEFFEAAKPYKGMKRDLYDGGIHVPMIVHWPASIKKPRVDDTPWAFADVLATFAEIGEVNLEELDGVLTNGVSVAGLLNDKPEPLPERILYWEFGKQVGDPNSGIVGDAFQAARKNEWKAVRYGTSKPVELYNIMKDPAESNNLAAEHPEIVDEFYTLFEKHKARDS